MVLRHSLVKAAGFGFMVQVARVWVFVGVVAWAAILVLMLAALGQALASRRQA